MRWRGYGGLPKSVPSFNLFSQRMQGLGTVGPRIAGSVVAEACVSGDTQGELDLYGVLSSEELEAAVHKLKYG